MNRRGAVKAVWIVSVLGVVFALLSLPSFGGFVGATDEGADCDSEAIPISEIALLNPNVHPSSGEVTIDLPRPIIAGTYSVTLVSFDDHSTNRPEQTEEQWFAQLLDADGRVVYESDPTRDLPDGHNFLTDTFDRQTVTGTATRLRAVHRGEGTSVNSVVPRCAFFTREPTGRIIVKKVMVPASEDQRFVFTADYGAFELGDGEQHDSGPIPAGTHILSEQAVAGWETTVTCSDGSMPDAIDLQKDEIITCTFTNTESPIDLVVTMDDAPRGDPATEPIVTPGDPFDYVVNVKNLGPEHADHVQAVLVVSEEITADVGALDPACVPAVPDEIVCSIGEVPVGEIIKVRVAVRVREDSPGIGTFVSSVMVGDEDFPGERNEPNNRDEEPTTFPVPEVAGLGVGGRTDVLASTGSNVRDFMLAALVTLGSGVLILTLNYEQRPLRPIPAARWAASLAREPSPIRSFAPTIDAAPSRHEPPMSMGAVFSRLPFELERLEAVAQRIRIVLERRMRNG